jgi:small subunit ribosomal protein S20
MPHTRSAKKQLRKSLKRRMHNRSVKKDVKTQIKRVMETCDEGTVEELRKEYNLAAKKLDKAAARRIIHPNLASRKKSQLAKMLHGKETAAKNAPAGGTPG